MPERRTIHPAGNGYGEGMLPSIAQPAVRTINVASVPAAHVYVRHIAAEEDDGVYRLPDPDPLEPQRSTEQVWWPPVMLRPEWVLDHASEFDVFHLHFGFDAWDPADLAQVVAALRDAGKPLVYTVHDLRNPHHEDRGLHDAQLDVLVPAADRLITLTSGAADEIRRRWGRRALALPHPHVVPLDRPRRRQGRRHQSPLRIGLHIKSLRASMEPLRLLPQLIETTRQLPNAVLQVNGHRDVLEPAGERRHDALAFFLTRAAERGDLDLRIHDFLSDDELWDYLESIDVSVLPYRFGTHSGWLEACRDLGTAVVAPSCGYFADQGRVHTYLHRDELYDPGSLHAAVVAASQVRTVPLSVESRRRQRAAVAAAHRDLYLSLLDIDDGLSSALPPCASA